MTVPTPTGWTYRERLELGGVTRDDPHLYRLRRDGVEEIWRPDFVTGSTRLGAYRGNPVVALEHRPSARPRRRLRAVPTPAATRPRSTRSQLSSWRLASPNYRVELTRWAERDAYRFFNEYSDAAEAGAYLAGRVTGTTITVEAVVPAAYGGRDRSSVHVGLPLGPAIRDALLWRYEAACQTVRWLSVDERWLMLSYVVWPSDEVEAATVAAFEVAA
jgi:hypothetical protein